MSTIDNRLCYLDRLIQLMNKDFCKTMGIDTRMVKLCDSIEKDLGIGRTLATGGIFSGGTSAIVGETIELERLRIVVDSKDKVTIYKDGVQVKNCTAINFEAKVNDVPKYTMYFIIPKIIR